jgi:hypothetical protein
LGQEVELEEVISLGEQHSVSSMTESWLSFWHVTII